MEVLTNCWFIDNWANDGSSFHVEADGEERIFRLYFVDGTEDRASADVLKLRVAACRALEKWEMMAEASNHLRKIEPDDVGHHLNMAYAVRRFRSESEAADILSLALRRYYDDALIRYNLACYWCVMGRVEEAREMLETAFKKDSSLRELAETEEDLAALG